MIVVGSLIVLAASDPPPETPTMFVTVAGALEATFTLTVITG